MEDSEEVEESLARGNDWEVVSLTASAYAAAPALAETKDDVKGGMPNPNADKAETSSPLFLSRHFDFHAMQHESPFHGTADMGALEKHKHQDDFVFEHAAQGRSSGKDERNWASKGLSVADEFPDLHFPDEKAAAFEEGKDRPRGLKSLADEEQSVYTSATFSSLHSEAASAIPPSNIENMTVPVVAETPDSAADTSADASRQPKQVKGDGLCGSDDLPCGAWWKRRAASFYAQAKEANALWSVFIAAAVMGLVILGQRWQQEKRQVLQLRWHLSINNESNDKIMPGSRSRSKDVIAGCCAPVLVLLLLTLHSYLIDDSDDDESSMAKE